MAVRCLPVWVMLGLDTSAKASKTRPSIVLVVARSEARLAAAAAMATGITAVAVLRTARLGAVVRARCLELGSTETVGRVGGIIRSWVALAKVGVAASATVSVRLATEAVPRAAVAEGGSLAGVAGAATTLLVGRNGNAAGRRGRGRGRRLRAGRRGARLGRGTGGRRPLGSRAVPVRLGVSKTVSDPGELVATVLGGRDHVGRQVPDSLLVHVVGQDKVVVTRGGIRHGRRVLVLGDLDQLGSIVFPVLCVKIGGDDVVTQCVQETQTA